MKDKDFSRRRFIGGVASTALTVSIVPRHVLGGRGYTPPSDKLNIACIGVGGKGRSDVVGVASENIVALCDVDEHRGADSFRRFPRVKRYKDFRIMLEKEKNLDAVTVSTPDHTHAVAAMMAIKLGKHVFCQKPLAHSIYEVRALGQAARKHKVSTQMGIQGHSNDGLRKLREWIEAGVIGTVREVHYWTNRPIWPQGIERPLEQYHLPKYLDWDLWLGPAPERAYHPAYHPFKWRGWWDFGTGALGDIGCHAMDAAFWILDLRNPARVAAERTPVNSETAPLTSRVTYHFPALPNRPEVKVVWRDGSLMPARPEELEEGRALPGGNSGQLFIGDKGKIAADIYCRDPKLIPESRHLQLLANSPDEKYPRSPGVYKEWIRACKGGQPAGANFADYASPLTEMVLLGNLAVRTGEIIEWDASKGRVTNISRPNQYIRHSYRNGWNLS